MASGLDLRNTPDIERPKEEIDLPSHDLAYNYNIMREKLFFKIKRDTK